MSPVWQHIVPAEELTYLHDRGFGAAQGVGDRLCLVVIDVTESFLGARPGAAVDESPMACGDSGWAALPRINELIDAARSAQVPVVFTKGDPVDKRFCGGSVKRTRDAATARAVHEAPFPAELMPRDDEYILSKPKASAFFGTPLISYLTSERVDTIVLCGTTTSGCVRATAVDAASLNLRVLVAEDACFDRSEFAHAANLFDIQMKYGDVQSTSEVASVLTASVVTKGL